MKIVDMGDKLKREHLEKERFKNIEFLAKNHFPTCNISKGNDAIHIYSSGREVASFSTFTYGPGVMKLYLKSYEEKAIKFGEEYEKNGLHKSFENWVQSPEKQNLILEKHYF